MPSERLRRLEVEANGAFDQYREMYFEGGVSSVYLWDLDHGFAGVILIKKAGDGSKKIKGCWDSIHVIEVQVLRFTFYPLSLYLCISNLSCNWQISPPPPFQCTLLFQPPNPALLVILHNSFLHIFFTLCTTLGDSDNMVEHILTYRNHYCCYSFFKKLDKFSVWKKYKICWQL